MAAGGYPVEGFKMEHRSGPRPLQIVRRSGNRQILYVLGQKLRKFQRSNPPSVMNDSPGAEQ